MQNSGRLIARASNKAPGKRGGSVVVTGEDVKLTSTSRIDVSSTAPGGTGGTVNIGGGYQGKDPSIAHARTTSVDAGSVIDANGGALGGTVVVWSDVATSYQGHISARGAAGGCRSAAAGDGRFCGGELEGKSGFQRDGGSSRRHSCCWIPPR